MYQRSEFGFGQAGLTVALSLDQVIPDARPRFGSSEWWTALQDRYAHVDLVPDLGTRIGSVEWFRGLATCMALCWASWLLAPGFQPLPASVPSVASGAAWEETRIQSIAPLAWGGDTGRHMAANDSVVPLAAVPDRPSLQLFATLGEGDGFARVLERAGVAGAEAQHVASLVASATSLDDIKPGTSLKITLGRRASRNEARPLDALDFRARIDLALALRRDAGKLAIRETHIPIDHTPLRIAGVAGESLYRAARAAGAPPLAVETYIRAIAAKMSLDDLSTDTRFDMVVERDRAATGEVELGKLLFVGLSQGSRKMQMLQWTIGGRTEWFDASGVGQPRPGMAQPVAGMRKTSGFGMRFHPLLGYTRMHQGTDYGAAYGAPIYAVSDGIVQFAGRHGGHGNYVRLSHSGGLGTGYAHMSRILVSPGARVAQGQVIGYVGSTGLSTGPHLHFETYRNGAVVNPSAVRFSATSLLNGAELANFKERLRALLSIPVAGSGKTG